MTDAQPTPATPLYDATFNLLPGDSVIVTQGGDTLFEHSPVAAERIRVRIDSEPADD